MDSDVNITWLCILAPCPVLICFVLFWKHSITFRILPSLQFLNSQSLIQGQLIAFGCFLPSLLIVVPGLEMSSGVIIWKPLLLGKLSTVFIINEGALSFEDIKTYRTGFSDTNHQKREIDPLAGPSK